MNNQRIHCIGIGGIGVSGLAQLLVRLGYHVSGSDRGLHDHGKEHLYKSLKQQGITLYPQDGSGPLAEKPDKLIVSSAVEDGNPDLISAPQCPVVHRATALAQAIDSIPAIQIAVAGSCGKTSVTGWIASALRALGKKVLMVNGGYVLDAESDSLPGNFFMDESPEYIVIEVDESDRSLSAFHPHIGVLLNVGNDHYSQEELKSVFAGFLSQCSQGAVVLHDLAELTADCHGTVTTFAQTPQDDPSVVAPIHFQTTPEGISFDTAAFGHVLSSQTGFHSAVNACAVLALLNILDLHVSHEQLINAVACFKGIRQRFEIMGRHPSGAAVVNDYAHNPEKLSAAISAARDRFGSPLTAVFQPHGFSPLRFMRETLAEALPRVLTPNDRLVLLPVFYAGGTAVHSPTSEDIAEDLQKHGLSVVSTDRAGAEAIFRQQSQSCILVMGARDASLRSWSQELCQLP